MDDNENDSGWKRIDHSCDPPRITKISREEAIKLGGLEKVVEMENADKDKKEKEQEEGKKL